MLALEQAKSILPSEASEEGAVVEGDLPVEVDLGGPPSGRAVFKLGPVGEKVVACVLGAKGGKVLDLEAAGLFEVVVVGDDIGALVGVAGKAMAVRINPMAA